MKSYRPACFALLVMLAGCSPATSDKKNETTADATAKKDSIASSAKPMASLATILAKKQVPVLCYHHIRNFAASQSESMKSYSVTPAAFAEQMKALHDSGFQTILPVCAGSWRD